MTNDDPRWVSKEQAKGDQAKGDWAEDSRPDPASSATQPAPNISTEHQPPGDARNPRDTVGSPAAEARSVRQRIATAEEGGDGAGAVVGRTRPVAANQNAADPEAGPEAANQNGISGNAVRPEDLVPAAGSAGREERSSQG